MNDIVSAASILAGTGGGAWLADKLLSPSMDALGQQIRAYAGKRLADILGIAEEKVASLTTVESLPPGYALNFLQKASFSEDDTLLTEMWGGLLASSASRMRPRHNLYVEILSQIGASEAALLNEIFPESAHCILTNDLNIDVRKSLFQAVTRSIDWASCKSEIEAKFVVDHLTRFNFEWPLRVGNVEAYWSPENSHGKTQWVRKAQFLGDRLTLDSLVRQRLIEYFEFDFSPGWASPKMDGYFMTALGISLVKECRGQEAEV